MGATVMMHFARFRILVLLAIVAGLGFFAHGAQAQTYNRFSPANGILVGDSSTYVTTAADSADVISLWTGTCNTTTFLRADGSCVAPPATVLPANPTATIGLTAVNGSAGTFLRSDGAPALSQAIVPTWTGVHTFNGSPGWSLARNSLARGLWNVLDSAADEKLWEMRAENTGTFSARTRTDADGVGATWLLVDRTGTAVDSIALTATAINMAGAVTSTGQLQSTSVGAGRTTAGSYINSATPYLRITETDQSADERDWILGAASGGLALHAITDAATTPPAGGRALLFNRGGASLTGMTFGNTTSNPLFVWQGTGTWSVGGGVGSSGQVLTSNGASAAPTWQNVGGGGDALLAGTQTFTGVNTFSNASSIVIQNTAAPADEKNTVIRQSALGGLALSTATDAAPSTAVNNAMSISTTGTAIDEVTLFANNSGTGTVGMRAGANGRFELSGTATDTIGKMNGNAAGASSVNYVSFRDSGGVEQGYVGDGSSGNSDISLAASTTGGHVLLVPGASGGNAYVRLSSVNFQVATQESTSASLSLTGVSGGPISCTVQLRRTGNIVSIFRPSTDCTGTSTSTAMTLTGIPAAYRPTFANQLVFCWAIDNTTLYSVSNCSVSTSGDITFGRNQITGGTNVQTGFGGNFTASGSKGIPGGWSITYAQ